MTFAMPQTIEVLEKSEGGRDGIHDVAGCWNVWPKAVASMRYETPLEGFCGGVEGVGRCHVFQSETGGVEEQTYSLFQGVRLLVQRSDEFRCLGV